MEDSPHRIRLRGPWQTADGLRVKLPATWSGALGESADREVVLSRRFQRGSISTEYDRVTLRVESPHQLLGVELNDATVDPDGENLVPVLEESNKLRVRLQRVEGVSANSESMLEVWLEVEDG